MTLGRKLAIAAGVITLLCFICEMGFYVAMVHSPDQGTGLLWAAFGVPSIGLCIVCTWLALVLYFTNHPRTETARAARWGFIVTVSNFSVITLFGTMSHVPWLSLLISISTPLLFGMVGIEYLIGVIILSSPGGERTGKALVWSAFFTTLLVVGWNFFFFGIVRKI